MTDIAHKMRAKSA